MADSATSGAASTGPKSAASTDTKGDTSKTPTGSSSSKSQTRTATSSTGAEGQNLTRTAAADPIAERRAQHMEATKGTRDQDDRKEGEPSELVAKLGKDLKGHKIVVVENGRIYLEGKEIDLDKDKPTKKDVPLFQAIVHQRPVDGEYFYNEEEGSLSPAGYRAGSGDTGTAVGSPARRTVHPNANRPLMGREEPFEDDDDMAGRYANSPDDTTEKAPR